MLQIKNISKKYKTGDLVQTALNDVSLNLRDNEFVAILGPSGSGKTTLLNIIGGLDRYDSGDLIINDVSTKNYKDRDWDTYRNHTIGFVFQSYNLIPHQTVLSNVELALTIGGISASERKKRALDALDKVGLKDQAHKKPNQMSGGQMQRVAIARALVNNPDIVLADEPTGALDTKTSVQVMDLLKEVAKDRLVVMVTHNPDLANEYSNRIIRLQDGEIISDSNPLIIEERPLKKRTDKVKKAKMSIFTALSLSFNNLLTKKGRTILTAFAGSIGIIGIALILSLSQGFQNYIDKIQEDTMTSYPLTIQSDTADIFSALLSMRVDASQEVEEGQVKEVMLVSSMMNAVGTNDLKSFKYYLENNTDKYEKDVKKITYSYSISPRIYTIDVTDNVTQLNPNTLMSSIYSDSMASAFSSLSSSTSSGAFSQVDFSTLPDKYTLVKGEYPQKYNEVLVVLPKENQVSDLLIYMLGLRDSKELKTMIQQIMNHETVTVEHDPMVLSYDDIMNVKFKLVNVSDLYKYNEQYDTYEDMSDDKEYMLDVYNKSEDLIITGVAYSTDDTSAGGVMYCKELTDHVIEVAKKSSIVKKQLADKNVDVFSGNKFDEENNKKEDLNFDDMVSVDEDMLKDAFQINISEDDFKMDAISEEETIKMLEDTSKAIYEQVATTVSDPEKIKEATTTISMINTGIASTAIDMYESAAVNDGYLALVGIPMISSSITGETYKQAINQIDKNLTMLFSNDDYNKLAEAVKSMINAYYADVLNRDDIINPDNPMTKAIAYSIDGENVKSYGSIDPVDSNTLLANMLADVTANSLILEVVPNYLKNTAVLLTEAQIGSLIGKVTSPFIEFMTGLGDLFGEDMMKIDTDKFAQAFKFDMDEDELSRLMTSMITGSTASYKNNLINLGYQDIDDPTSISIFFKDFDSKENFLNFLDAYNENVNDDEKQIKYTDITGLLMGSVKKIIDSVTYVLIAFVSISLVVSSIMIAVITLISVMERTKEIGILRAMGASKHNVSSIFNAETFIIGLLSGLLGVGVTFALIPPINALIHNVTDNYDINAVLPTKYAIILVLISVFLTIIAGIIPSRKASKQDPVIALRTE